MKLNWYLIYAYALGASFAVSLVLTAVVRKAAIRWRVLDQPGERKVHAEPIPLMGGVAICSTFYLIIFANLAVLKLVPADTIEWVQLHVNNFLGEHVIRKLTGIAVGGLLIFVLGFVDDLKALKPEVKLVGQVAAGLVLVLSGIRLDVFIDNPWMTGAATVFWIVFMTNSLNFLDNMDGLCGGVSVIAAFSFFFCLSDETFIRVMLMVFAGAYAGFLYHNLNPARIFMGDAGSMFSGYILATVAVLGTFYHAGGDGSTPRAAIAAPLLALGVPIFDTLSVVYIRWRNGESIMKGDKRHFSHRLVNLGMSPRQAVEFIFLVAGVTGLGAALLPHVGRSGVLIILAQTLGVFSLIVLLMNAGNHRREKREP